MSQKISVISNPNYLSDKVREVHIDDINIDKNNNKVRTLYRVIYLNKDNTPVNLAGYSTEQKAATVDNNTLVNPLTGDDSNDKGAIGKYDFLRSLTPEFLRTIYPSAKNMGELIDALADLMIKKMVQDGKID